MLHDESQIAEMVTWQPRRYRLCDWNAAPAPTESYHSQLIAFPFEQTFWPLFERMCPYPNSGLKYNNGGRPFVTMKGATALQTNAVLNWVAGMRSFVANRDWLTMSLSLDYDKLDGNPNAGHTRIGHLRGLAKPYSGSVTNDGLVAAQEIATHLVSAIGFLTPYANCDGVVAMPPSRPDKPFDLPRYLAALVSQRTGLADLSESVVTSVARPQLKSLSVQQKLSTLQGTISVDSSAIAGKRLILLDDLYQSGVSMNYAALEMLRAGAVDVYGLACEKTCRNDDNT